MKPLTIAQPVYHDDGPGPETLNEHPLVDRVLHLQGSGVSAPDGAAGIISVDTFFSGRLINELLETWKSDFLLLVFPGGRLEWGSRALERLHQVAADCRAGLLYCDFRDRRGGESGDHPLIDYQLGSLRDNFDFGGAVLLSRKEVDRALQLCGPVNSDLKWGGLYDLRLKLSQVSRIKRLPEMLYTRSIVDHRLTGERVFDYVHPAQRPYQIEMEHLASEHLKRLGAWLKPDFNTVPQTSDKYNTLASIIIPVRNRVRTIGEAVNSALEQQTSFDFNIIVVDNHSTDGTTELLSQLESDNVKLIHVIPSRKDLGIGGCWNEAIYSKRCGRYAVQLDSDDLYSGPGTLAQVVAKFIEGGYAMVIGSYTTVDFGLQELPPGLIDHREWTRENGRNNALRINGLGAPRAFDVHVLREVGLPNISYGEDYAVALRLSRDYEIGRIYESLYLARRWGGNSDSSLPLPTMNRYDAYKDFVRTQEMLARLAINRSESTNELV